mmetsp:Transcript_126467/g.188716  ORF Transcript_126467/g.188716 Transcript_126467/m.188716 type:complete len:155 (+) Transcript_126467:103-567(+)|eukprot:CAMPEP_0117053204 /NCGR_PEP_ID=MMETSP0472-20121206/36793_1 /TAXON_ID=693140 ORGANISM="Tiarina fusus, Strain LIS" /NCGR_SAMPLE_ID=MMETSP0472 /ASSEMBLY_ACC=CAM_ASM_000603 /LENGTH=154 /DNA_ID=CAMNT_0004768157 /DNA_START=103 /DNA_END=567 /DNA_ORIENTATION=-
MSASKKESNLGKIFAVNSKPTATTFPELPDYIVWARFVLAVGYGIWLGTSSQSRGGAGVMFGLNFIVFVPMLYCTTFLGADSESYGTKLLFSGVFNGFALMLLIWIYFYSLDHVEDEKILSNALLSAVKGIVDSDVAEVDVADLSEPVVEDSEF